MLLLQVIVSVATLLSSHRLGVYSTELKSPESNGKHQSSNLVYDHYRLPTAVRPEKYTLKIITHLEDPSNLRFNGEVHIQMSILEDTNNITLHAQNLTIEHSRMKLQRLQNATAEGKAVTENCIQSTATNDLYYYLILELCSMAKEGDQYLLTIPFAGILRDDLKGYYKSSYRNVATKEIHWLSVTHFEPASARRAFPCFDEPSFKANFTIIMGHQKQYTALSNMPLKDRKPMSDMLDWIWSEFEESVPMSTYLVAYTVNDFAYKSSETSLKNKVLFRTWARPDAIDQCNYAGDIGPKVLQYYEDIFDIKFPLPKVDQIALPDFGPGAMENWGLVTYRETALLYAENVASFASKQRVAEVVAHELAHQWFGNLVTMKWWTDLWLNEGFATYIATLGVNHVHSNWNFMELDYIEDLLTIFAIDSLKSSHPISQPIMEINQIAEIANPIAYKKGSSVLRMMHSFIGDEAFRNGVNRYLKQHAYSNADQDDLWKSFTESAQEAGVLPENYDIKTIMDSWTLQTGYPIITVTRDYRKRTAKITQSRYLINSNYTLRSNEQNCWWVPLTYTTKSELSFEETVPKTWLECSSDKIAVTKELTDMPPEDEWVLFNLQMSGIYKVKYDERNWNMLIETLVSDDFKKIDVISRAHLIDDALTLAWSKDENYDVALRLIEYLHREKEYIPWKSALSSLAAVDKIMRETSGYEFFKRYMEKILTPIYIHLRGLNSTNMDTERRNSDAQLTIQHKVLIASWACRFEVDDCVPRALKYFIEWRNEPNPDAKNPIPTDLRGIVYCNAIRHSGDKDWNFLWDRYQNSNVATEKKIILQALGCTRVSWLLARFLEWTYSGNALVRKQDSTFAFTAVANNDIGARLARNYFMDNVKVLHDLFADIRKFAQLLQSLARQISNRRDYEALKDFIEGNKKYFTQTVQGTRRSLETAEIQCQWKEENYANFTRLLREKVISK